MSLEEFHNTLPEIVEMWENGQTDTKVFYIGKDKEGKYHYFTWESDILTEDGIREHLE